jgi:hypothetical protein
VLEEQHRLALAAYRTFTDQLSGSPEEIVDRLFSQLSVWSSGRRWSGSGITRLVMELADLSGHPAHAIARRHKAMVEAHFADLLTSANVEAPTERAREICLLLEGTNSLMLVHRDRAYVEAAAHAAKRLLRGSST